MMSRNGIVILIYHRHKPIGLRIVTTTFIQAQSRKNFNKLYANSTVRKLLENAHLEEREVVGKVIFVWMLERYRLSDLGRTG
jgi:hypothetical protein